MEAHLRNFPQSTLPLIYPIVLYSGKKRWHAPLEIFPLFGEQETLARQWLLKPYQVLDIQRISDETLQQHLYCGLVEFSLKHRLIRDFDAFLEKLLPWIHTIELQIPRGSLLGKIVLQYVMDGIQADDVELFIQKINHSPLSTKLRGEIMTIAQCLEQRGIERGIERGVERGVQKGEVNMIMRLIQRRFGSIPATYQEKITTADAQTLLLWGERVLDAQTLEAIFATEE